MFEVYEIHFVNKSPLLITSPESEGNYLRTMKIWVNDRLVPVIPSTSLKGPLRRWSEILAKNADWDGKIGDAVRGHREDEQFGIIHMKKEKYLRLKDYDREMKEFEIAKSCPICYLFGSKVYAGAVALSSALPISDYKYHTYSSVSIDNQTRTKKEKALFTIEAVAPGTEFKVFVVIREQVWADEETRRAAKRLWEQILTLWEDPGIRIGRRKSSGYGLIQLTKIKSLSKI